MKILRLLTIRLIFFGGLVAALALPTGALAGVVNETTAKTGIHKTTTKKNVKKAVKKSVKKSAKKPAKKVAKPAAKPTDFTGKYVSAAKDGINVLADPASDAAVRWEIFDKFPLLVKKRQGAWLQVTDFEGDTGWIRDSQVTGEKSVIVCKKRINLRPEPNTNKNNPLVAVVRYGVLFTPMEKKADWLKVRHADGTEGWLKNDLVWPSNPLD